MIIWRFIDGKLGHEKQSQALINHLSRVHDVDVIDFSINHSALFYFWHWLTGGHLGPKDPRKPSLIIGAGHRTHLPILFAGRQQGAKTLVIMSPSLPSRCFDLIVAPEHDYFHRKKPPNIITTPFAIADIIDSKPNDTKALMLLGGPSKLFDWNTTEIVQQLRTIIENSPTGIHWTISNSRRTPADMLDNIQKALEPLDTKIDLLDSKDLPTTWLQSQLQQAGYIWVGADSASMLAEALATKAKVGLITMTSKKPHNKLLLAQQHLLEQGIIFSSASIQHADNSNIERLFNQHLVDNIIKNLELTP